MSQRKRVLLGVLVVMFSLLASARTGAVTVFGTLFTNPGTLVRIDTVSGLVTPFFTTGAFPDSIVFDSSGRMIYTLFGANQVRRFDPSNGTDVLLSGSFSGPLDLVLDPGGATVLVSNNTTPRIDRLNLTTGVVTPFFAAGGGAALAYDASGRLFANLPGRVAELNPLTGAVLQFTPGVLILDGLTFDPVTGNLFATDGSGGHVFRLDRNNLALGAQLFATLIASGGFVDGIVADGTGQLFVAVRNVGNESLSGLVRVNAVSGASGQVAFAAVLDDIAPLVGQGAPPVVPAGPSVPVPTVSDAALIALGVGLAILALVRIRTGNRRPQ